ncbi:hypothetical protein CKQ53_07530 [Lonsdalea britannica]|uniref:Uncharacterized protein n=1 Tax=Lonsdalea britannica TaxID=1082704 RepID=A0AAD0SFP3_9GAMM|nr:hypothetical protein CKQ53_07530 [Lonsdalea britannica]
MGAFMGALFTRNTNKTNNKQHINRRYDPESGTTYSEKPAYWLVFCFLEYCLFTEPRSMIRRKRLTPSGSARQRAVQRLRRSPPPFLFYAFLSRPIMFRFNELA